MSKNLKIILLLSRFSAKTSLNNPLGVVFFTLGKLLRFGLFLGIILFLVSRTGTIKGYTTAQAVVFFLTFNLVDTTTQFLFREVYRFRSLIVSGDFNTVLVKPHHPFVRVLLGGVDILDFVMLLFYLPLTAFAIVKTGVVSPVQIGLYIALVVNALVIGTAFHILVLALGVFSTQVDHAVMIYRDVFSMGRFPMEIYREPLRSFFTFIVPVGVMVTFPARALFNLLEPSMFIFSFAISTVGLYLSLLLWKMALKKYQSWGG